MSDKITITIAQSRDRSPHLTGFRYWWLKEVAGYRLDVHCQACLLGPLNRRFNARQPVGERIEVPGDLAYLCGVSDDYAMDKNFHAPVELAVGESFEMTTYNGFVILFENARRLAIEPLPPGWNGLSRYFTRCRNYQFAVQMTQRQALADLK